MAEDAADAERRQHLVRGMEAFAAERWQEAIDALQLAGRERDEVRYALTRAAAWGRLSGDAAMRDELLRALVWAPDDPELNLRAARVSLKLDALDQAVRLAAHATQVAPTSKDAAIVAFEVASKLGRGPDAATHLETATALAPSDPHLRARILRFYAGHRDAERARHHAQALVALQPDGVDGWLRLAESALDLDLNDDARDAVAHVEALTPDQWRKVLTLHVRIGDLDRAQQTVVRASAAPSEAAEAQAATATLALWRGDLDAAGSLAAQVLALQPDHLEAPLVLAAIAVLRGDPTAAVPMLERVRTGLRSRPDPDGWLTEDVACVWLAAAWRARGERARASAFGHLAMASCPAYSLAAHVQRLLATLRPTDDPEQPLGTKAWLRLGRLVAPLIDDPAAAEASTVHAVTTALESVLVRLGGNRSAWTTTVHGEVWSRWHTPPWPRNRARLVQHLLKTRPIAEVLELFRELQDRFPDDPTPHTYHGEVLLWIGQPAQAATAFQAALDLEQTTTWAWIGMGAAALFQGQAADALSWWERGVEVLQYEGPTLFVYRAEAHARLGDTDAAIADLDRALVAKPERLSAWLHRARVEAQRGNPAPAEQLVARIRERLPGLAVDTQGDTDRDAPAAVDAMLTAMRGNRSSTILTWHDPTGALRFGSWGRWYRPGDTFPSAAALQDARKTSLHTRTKAREVE